MKGHADAASMAAHAPCSVEPPQAASKILKRGAAALSLLVEAFLYAQELDLDRWDFAIEIDMLRRNGLSDSDLRWLICKALVEQGRELSAPGEGTRLFRPTRSLAFHRKSCFVLSRDGLAFARQSLVARDPLAAENGYAGQRDSDIVRPTWDRHRQEFRLGNVIIKQFKVPAPNQETILAAFEEENWPTRIDDPLPPQPEQDSKRRLHDTINSLNRNQKSTLIRFIGDGSGLGVRWEQIGRGNGSAPQSVAIALTKVNGHRAES